jgi:hypothetical protein
MNRWLAAFAFQSAQSQKKGRSLSWRPKSREETPNEGSERRREPPFALHNLSLRCKKSIPKVGAMQILHNTDKSPAISLDETCLYDKDLT